MNNLKNTFETEKKGLTDKQQDMEKIKSDNESQLKSQLELKCKELSDVQAKQKVAMTHARLSHQQAAKVLLTTLTIRTDSTFRAKALRREL